MKNTNIIMAIVVLLIVGGGAFFAGTKYQQGKILSQRSQFAAGQFGNRAGGTQNAAAGQRVAGRGGQVLGTILSQDSNSITVKMADGSSKIVLISGTTSINKASEASMADLKVGETVSAFGTSNSDGSISAQNIQLNPVTRAPVTTGTMNQK